MLLAKRLESNEQEIQAIHKELALCKSTSREQQARHLREEAKLQQCAGQLQADLTESKAALASLRTLLNMDSVTTPADVKQRLLNSFENLTLQASRLVEALDQTALDAASLLTRSSCGVECCETLFHVFRTNDGDMATFLDSALPQVYMEAAIQCIWDPLCPGELTAL